MKPISARLIASFAAMSLLPVVGCSSDEAGNGGGKDAGGTTGGGLQTGGSTSTGGSGGSSGQANGTGGTTGGSTGASGGTTGGSTGGAMPGTGGAAAGMPSTGGSSAGASVGGTGAGVAGMTNAGTGGGAGATGGRGGAGATGGNGSGGKPALGGFGGAGASGGAAGAPATVDCATAGAVITYPDFPGATASPLYTLTANGAPVFVEKMTKFSPEMQVHYANFSVATGCTATIAVTLSQSFSSYTLSPKSRNLTATKSGNTLTFTSGPNYLILQFDNKELLFVLIDEQETNPPHVGDANVKSIADYSVDNTGATLETSKIQSAINAASGATQNVLYFPPGRYKTGELSLKSNMTLYLAGGALLDGSTKTSDYAAAGPAVESTTHGVLHLNNVSNTNVLGRGVIDGNGSIIRGTSNDTPSFKINVLRVDGSSKVVIDGITVRDPVFWNTLVYNSDQVSFKNYKVINRRPTTTTYNQEDGVDYDCSTNGNVFNAFIYSGDDSMSPKREQEGMIDTKNITYEKVVAYSNSAATKIGTKTFGNTIDGVTFKDMDIVKAGRAMVIDANDTALITNTKWENIRIEAADSNLIDIEEDRAPDWRTAPNTSTVKDAYFTDISCGVKQLINIHGLSSSVTVNGVHFSGFTVQGKPVTSQTDSDASWNINSFVSNITFQ
jgi:hypothetical protein